MEEQRTPISVIRDELITIRRILWAYANTTLSQEQKEEFLRSFNDPENYSEEIE